MANLLSGTVAAANRRPVPSASRLHLFLYSLKHVAVAGLVSSGLTACSMFSGPQRIEIPANTDDFKSRLYAGVAVGNSHLKPDTRGTSFNVDSSGDLGTQLRLGYDVHNMLAVEFDTSVLGSSQLREANTDVKYSSATVSALIYGLSGVQLRSRREGLSAYGRVGFAALKKSSAVLPLEESGTVPVLGVGAEYGFINGLGVRAELTRFDSDAVYLGFGAVYRFGISPAGIGTLIADAAEPALRSRDTRVGKDGRVLGRETVVERYAGPNARSFANRGKDPHFHYAAGAQPNAEFSASMADRWRPAMRADDTDSDGVLDNADRCPSTTRFVTVDRYGCGLFDAVLADVTFKSGSDWLTPRARGQLDRLAETLLAFPESRIQVRAHTDSVGPADRNMALATRRSEVVVQYLQSRGVNELQLQAVGMGEAQPIDSNKTAVGRRKNRRVDVVTLPDQDAGQILTPVNVESTQVLAATSAPNKERTIAIGSEQWNTAQPFRRPAKVPSSPVENTAEPGLMAAMPAQKPKLALMNPLPRPGIVRGFPVTGVIEGLSFENGKSELSSDGQKSLQTLLNAMLEFEQTRIAVMAHTDDRGSIEENKAISAARAEAVVKYLADNGVDRSRMKAEGYGELLPLVQNVTDADRARNRRIEIRILAAESY
jgi:outer membrane protein OmpA-like peptidoglycan-associated protein/opacity protein-like surface antigen